MLDGRHLWLAVDPAGASGPRISLHWADGRCTDLPSVVEAEPRTTGGSGTVVHCQVPLADLVARAPAGLDDGSCLARVVLRTDAGVTDPDVPAGVLDGRVRRPASMPAGVRGELRPGEGGSLELVLWRAHGLAHLRRAAIEDGSFRLLVATDLVADAVVLLDDDRVVSAVEAGPVPDGTSCLLDPAVHATASPTARLVVAVRAQGHVTPVRRPSDDLDEPDAAVALPAVTAGDGRVLRLAWDPDGVLVVARVPDRDVGGR